MAIRRNLGIPSGVVFPFAGGVAPSGYLICDGSAISRADYPQLFLTIGTSHGQGDGSTTFNLPDYRGKFLRGVDGLAGVDPDKASRAAMATGGNTGNAVGSVQSDAMQGHGHDFYAGNTASGFGHGINNNQIALADNAGSRSIQSSAAGAQDQIQNVKNLTGFGTAKSSTETRPANVNVNYIIKV